MSGPITFPLFTSSGDGQIPIASASGSPVWTTLNGSNGVGIINGSNSITLSVVPSSVMDPVTTVDHAMSPYTVLSSDYILLVNTSGGTVTLNFFNAPGSGASWIIKDNGHAGTNNITITTPGGTVTFDGSTSVTLNTNYAAREMFSDGTNYWFSSLS